MRNMSFAYTAEQIIDGTKTVTRRMGWTFLRPGMLLRPVRKCMGLKRGEKMEVLRDPIRVVGIRREELRAMLNDTVYGLRECALEGFGDDAQFRWPSVFVEWFCSTHRRCTPGTVITRIAFEYENGASGRVE